MKQIKARRVVASIPAAIVDKKNIPHGTCFTPLPTSAEIHSQWFAKAKKNKVDNGSNSGVEMFMQVINRVRATQKSFLFSEVLRMCRNSESLEVNEIRRLWDSYKEFAIQHCILEEVSGCMDESVFFWN
jgi:hypothetical protein